MLAFSKLPREKRTPLIESAVARGIDFLFSVDPATAAYPTGYTKKPSGNWWKFGFPVFYVTDLLQNVEALARLGYGNDPRLENAAQLIRDKQDEQGRWAMEYSLHRQDLVGLWRKETAQQMGHTAGFVGTEIGGTHPEEEIMFEIPEMS